MDTQAVNNGDFISIPMTRTDWQEIVEWAHSISPAPAAIGLLSAAVRQRLREPRRPLDTRYRLMSDNDGHKYVVPVSYEKHFEKILLDNLDPSEYYTRVEGGLTFTDPLEL